MAEMMHDAEMMPDGEGMAHEQIDGMDPDLHNIFTGIVARLEDDAQNRVAQRKVVEYRWLEDARQFEGEGAPPHNPRQSAAVFNITRSKVNTFVSKVGDMLFPTDDRNGAVTATPVAEMESEAKRMAGDIERMVAGANAEADDETAAGIKGEADGLAQRLAEIETERQGATEKAKLMDDEIWDNLTECHYPSHARNCKREAAKYGTGFLKGPLPLSDRTRTYWDQSDSGWKLARDRDAADRFCVDWVSCWNLFPDVAARDFTRVESWMERHLMTRRDLREFAKQPGVFKDAVRDILRDGPQEAIPSYLSELDTISDEETTSARSYDKVFVAWEYRGPLEDEEMQAILRVLMMDADSALDPELAEQLMDPLLSVDAAVWFCQGRAVKVAINHLDDNASLYNAFQIEKSDARLWGPGIAYLMRDQQNVLTDGWRAMLDNASFGARPMFEIDEMAVRPNEGTDFIIEPGAVFIKLSGSGDRQGVRVITIPIVQEHWAAILQLAMQFVDTETNISILAQGEQGQTSKTAGGMALLVNNMNIVFRRVIKEWDDAITSPILGKSYNFLMQFSEKEEIKGDYAVHARGSSVLLVREIQAQNLLLLATQATVHPALGTHLKIREILKRLVQSMMLSSDDIIKTQAELEAELAAQAEEAKNAPDDPAMVQLQLQQQVAQMEAETKMAQMQMQGQMAQMEMQSKMALAQMSAESDLIKLAAQQNMSVEQAAAKLQAIREQTASKERLAAAEIGVDSRKSPGESTAGGLV